MWGYDRARLRRALERLGLARGDVVMAHCGFDPSSGFDGSPADVIAALTATVGDEGTVSMMSMPYHGVSTYEYLRGGRPFDVRRSVSMVGMVTEAFRRMPDVVRGAHPTHPVAARGPRAHWLVSTDPEELSPFGDRSPFARLVEAGGKIVLYGVPFNTMTLEHYLEHQIREHLPAPLYREEPMRALVIDETGARREVETLVLGETIGRMRRSSWLETGLVRRGALKKSRVGRTPLMVGAAPAMVDAVWDMVRHGEGFHDSSTVT
jgi:aminoglycoside 3-N-acetyltransferase